ncbi:MAG: phosphate/phosphite/phosphonate ABC transporter substrate-binding protein [Leptolyngbya sp. SIO1E4]|nr:phosphate/phosphite/phosphonate ABC transporter substrate-binding protein [Leptolyngbya sp. SIO1E4]
MLPNRLPDFISIGLVMGLVSCGSVPTIDAEISTTTEPETVAAAETATNSLVLGDISKNDPAGSFEEFQPLADYLAIQLAETGIDDGKVKVAPDIETMGQWLAAGEVDIFFDSPYPALSLAAEVGARPILRRWKKGDAQYHAIIFTVADSGIDSVQDLSGNLIAFDSPYSTSGYMLPMFYLLEENLAPVEKDSLRSTVANDEVGYIFTYDDSNTLQWVINGDVAAGVVDNQTFAELPDIIRGNLRILLETEAIPRQIAIIAADLEPLTVDALTQVLLDIDQSTEGKAVLEQFERTAKFDQFPTPNYLNRLEEMFARVNEWPE